MTWCVFKTMLTFLDHTLHLCQVRSGRIRSGQVSVAFHTVVSPGRGDMTLSSSRSAAASCAFIAMHALPGVHSASSNGSRAPA